MKRTVLNLVVFSSLGLVLFPGAVATAQTNIFTVTGSMSTRRIDHTSTLLLNGKILVTGGWDGDAYSRSSASAELYDPSQGQFTPTGTMTIARRSHTATLLPSGKVLITGGSEWYDFASYTASAEVYDPVTGIFTATGSMSIVRRFHRATLLLNGNVLITGGNSGYLYFPRHAELYDSVTGEFTTTGSMSTGRVFHAAPLLNNGKVLVTGRDLDVWGGSADLYDPATGAFTSTGPMSTSRQPITATLLINGKVLVTDGDVWNTGSAELYDPAIGAFIPTSSMITNRSYHTATLLSNGKVLAAGGEQWGSEGLWIRASAELYDPETGSFSATGPMVTERTQHTATRLPNGSVLVAGGSDYSYAGVVSAELYAPMTFSRLVELVNQFETKAGVASDMVATLQGAQGALAGGNVKTGNAQLNAFINQVKAQAGKSMTATQATSLIRSAEVLMM